MKIPRMVATTTAASLLLILLTPISQVSSQEAAVQVCAHVIGGSVSQESSGNWLVAAMVSSPYEAETSWEKYADEWKIEREDTNGAITLLGTRTLGHPHENEQPFTRSLSGVVIPEGVAVVTLSARDSVSGYCGDAFEVILLGRETDASTSTPGNETTTGMSFINGNETSFVNNTASDSATGDSTTEQPAADLIIVENALEDTPASGSKFGQSIGCGTLLVVVLVGVWSAL